MKITELNQQGSSSSREIYQNGNKEAATISSGSQAQQHEECVLSTLDAVCSSHQQTYDQFMSQFTQLTPENVHTSPTDTDDSGVPADFLAVQRKTFLSQVATGQANTVGGAKFLNMLPPISGNASELAGDVEFAEVSTSHETNAAINYDPDAIEEQVLTEGTKTQSFLLRPEAVGSKVKIKIGNFTDDVDGSDSESDCDDVYMPSFGNLSENNHEAECDKRQPSSTKQKAVPTPKHSQSPSTSQQEKNIPEQQSKDSSQSKKKRKKNKRKRSGKRGKNKKTDESQGQNLSDPIQIGNTNSEKKDMSTKIQMDQSKGILDLINAEDSDIESDCSDLVYDPSLDGLNFGEIGEDSNDSNFGKRAKVNSKKTRLDFKVVTKSDGEGKAGGNNVKNNDSTANEEVPCSDSIESFELDTTFDYDNVTLTPKYNQAEMAIIMGAVRARPVDPMSQEDDVEE